MMPAFPFSRPHTKADFNVPGVDELSASLGLPSAKKENALDTSPVRRHNPRASQILSSALYGKLIDKALDKPLTANALARYLKDGSEPSHGTVKTYQEPQQIPTSGSTPTEEQVQSMKIVPPPPGFQGQLPRMVTVEEDNTHENPAAAQQVGAQAAPFSFLQQHGPDFGQPSTPSRHLRRLPRRPRGHTRTKRTDQGPEPSAADIYPDDAMWTPTQPVYHNYFVHSPYMAPAPQVVVQTEDATNWPTPAEVYMHKTSQASPVAYVPQDFDIPKSHTAPTTKGWAGADRNVRTLFEQIPEPSINELFQFDALDLNPDNRSLSPDQMSGKRYGLNYFGIGLGDNWDPPYAAEASPFRVRPRDHQGWGGWQWAIDKGWADS
jgi:hypothetical protein